jgi:hypothetical protein
MTRKFAGIFMFVLTASAAAAGQAEAGYIDPNTGGLLFQMLAVVFAFLSGMVLMFSSYIKRGVYRVSRMLRGKRAPNNLEEQA